MAPNSIDISAAKKAIAAGVNGDLSAGTQLLQALAKTTHPELWGQGLQCPGGIFMIAADSEGIGAIIRSYSRLKDNVTPENFAEQIAEELNRFAEHLPEDRHNLCSPHFLLHGLVQDTVEAVIAKISDNARIMRSTEEHRDRIFLLDPPTSRIAGYTFHLGSGDIDGFQGIRIGLNKEARSLTLAPLAKIEFFIDNENSTAVIINVQGRKNHYQRPAPNAGDDAKAISRYESALTKYRIAAEEGREYARIHAQLKMDPRSYVITELIDLLQLNGIKQVKAIRATEHVMHIGRHADFYPRYDKVFEEVGMADSGSIYFTKTL
jgi:hypothetical protein